jgi:hypothetical protein
MRKTGYFDNIDHLKAIVKMLIGVIVAMLIVNIFIAKGLISVANNKTVVIQVPQVLEPGKYAIGASKASEQVYKMWARVWVDSIGTFSYKNIRKKFESIYPFLDPNTVYKSKSDIKKFIDFVERNFISQRFDIESIKVKPINDRYTKIIVVGRFKRTIGKTQDQLSGIRYMYEFTTYINGGQIWIKGIKSSFFGHLDPNEKKALKKNKYLNFDETIQ